MEVQTQYQANELMSWFYIKECHNNFIHASYNLNQSINKAQYLNTCMKIMQSC